MDNNPRNLTAEWQRERLHIARRHGGMCAGCGRALGESETVYIEQFEDDRGANVTAPVGVEYVSEELLENTTGQEAERCAGCGRPVFYRRTHTARRQQALCSRACSARVQGIKQSKAED